MIIHIDFRFDYVSFNRIGVFVYIRTLTCRLSMGVFLGASSGWSGSSGRPRRRSAWKETRGRELLLKGLVSKPEVEDQQGYVITQDYST